MSTTGWNAIVHESSKFYTFFFILKSLTSSKIRKFQTLKLSQFHKANTCWTENWWSSGITYEQLFRAVFFYVLGVNKYLSVHTKKLHKIKFKDFFLILGKKFTNFKHELSPSKPLLRSTQSLILRANWYCYFGRIIDPKVSLSNFLTFNLIAATQTNTLASLMVPAFWQNMNSQELTETENGCFSKLGYILYIF